MTSELLLRHPGDARVTTSEPGRGTARQLRALDLRRRGRPDVQRAAQAGHASGRSRDRGVAAWTRAFPGRSRVYEPLTPLPMETLPETFVHPPATARTCSRRATAGSAGLDEVAGREAIVVECDHPRTIEMAADRPDFRIRLAVDRRTA